MRGHEPADRPFVRFDPPRDTGVSVQVGYPVPEGVSGAGEVELGELPACRAATAVCEGTAEELLSAWYELVDYASDHGRARGPGWGGSGGWHVYLGDPPESAESRVEVRLVLPLETARESGVS